MKISKSCTIAGHCVKSKCSCGANNDDDTVDADDNDNDDNDNDDNDNEDNDNDDNDKSRMMMTVLCGWSWVCSMCRRGSGRRRIRAA